MSDTFYRDQLVSKQARDYYDEINQSIARGNVGGIFPLGDPKLPSAGRDAFDAIRALRDDRPDYFFLGRISHGLFQKNRLVLMNEVSYTPEQIARIRIHLERALNRLTSGTERMSQWEREKTIYERLARSLTYADHGDLYESKHYDHNVVGPLLQGSGVCEGISCLLTLALRKAGIPCIRVCGYGKKEAHCWNMAWIEGVPVHLDLTWDTADSNGVVRFAYFNLTDEQITRDHRITTKGLPRCTDSSKGDSFRRQMRKP